jgi:hypothetical protein
VSHASMSLKKKKPASGRQRKRVARSVGVRGKGGQRKEEGVEARACKDVDELGAREVRVQGAVVEGGECRPVLLSALGAERIENRGAPPALPTPIATFTI